MSLVARLTRFPDLQIACGSAVPKTAVCLLKNCACLVGGLLAFCFITGDVYAAALPGPADAARIEQREEFHVPETTVSPERPPAQVFPTAPPPAGSQQAALRLQDVHVTGMTVFATKDVQDIYGPFVGHDITLDNVWVMAGQLTERYRNAGYFLTHVVVPQQEVKNGIVTLRVVEGYIGDVRLEGPLAEKRVVKQWLEKLESYHPIKAEQVESVLLHLNDLPGVDLHAVLVPMENVESTEGAVRLVLEPRDVPFVTGGVSFDNNGSRFLGPYEAQAQASAVFWPTQRTTVSLLSSLPWDEVKYGSLKHELPLFAGATLEMYGSYTHAMPGYTLKSEDIKSASTMLGTAIVYSLIRQRQENLSARVAFEGQNTHSDILGTPLTRDATRTFRLGLNYQRADQWEGLNALSGTLSHGVDILGASQAGQENISRVGATPDFTKFNVDASRLQNITDDWSLLAAVSGQIASGSLYSSEQFGYGGQAFGRAYDNSEITGDRGVAGSTELRYAGIEPYRHFQPVPYGFYDLGAVWNRRATPPTSPYASGSSAGVGFRLVSDFGLAGNFGLGVPLTRPAANPLYGNGKSPRYYMQLSCGF